MLVEDRFGSGKDKADLRGQITVIGSLLGGAGTSAVTDRKQVRSREYCSRAAEGRRVGAAGWGHLDEEAAAGTRRQEAGGQRGLPTRHTASPLRNAGADGQTNPHQTLPDKVAGVHLEPETQDCGVPSAPLRSARRPGLDWAQGLQHSRTRPKRLLSQLELDFVSALPLVLCKLGQITLSL